MEIMSWTNREYVLKVGEIADIKRSFFGTSYSVLYAGMPGESVYSVVITRASGYHSLAYNLFLPVENTKIKLPKGFLDVSHISADEIWFKVGS